jgi:hypothetical protein
LRGVFASRPPGFCDPEPTTTLTTCSNDLQAPMEILTLVMVIALVAYAINARDQARRIALLGRHLGHFQIEKLMENLTEGYLRALGEADPERQAQVMNLMSASEIELSGQFSRFVAEFSQVEATQARVSKFAWPFPYAAQLVPKATFDMRKLLAVHAHGIADAANNRQGQSVRDKAFTLSAELFLMQHSCHWFCRSRAVASARVLARHKTTYTQVLAAVAPSTRNAYEAVLAA